MDESAALAAFGGLSHETRLRMVRLLVEAGPDGLSSSALGDAVEASPSVTSFHLRVLEQAALVKCRPGAGADVYVIAFGTMSGLVTFLLSDCCRARPDLCVPVRSAISSLGAAL